MSTLISSRRLWLAVPTAVVLLWLLGLLVVEPVPGIPALDGVVLVVQPVARVARDIACAMTLVSIVVGGLLCRPRDVRVLAWGSAWACAWLVAVAVQAVGTAWEVFASAPTVASLWSFMTQTQAGAVLVAQIVLIGLVAMLAWAVISSTTAWVVTCLAVVAAGLSGILGHSGLGEHTAAAVSLGLHVAAVSLWMGGLAVVVAVCTVDRVVPVGVVGRFSWLALGCVIVVAETGLLNASLRLTVAPLLSGTYGALLVAKALLLLLLVSFGLDQRRRSLPALRAEAASADPASHIGRSLLVRVAAGELLLMGAAIGLSVVMVRLGPLPDLATARSIDPFVVVLLALGVPLVVRRLLRSAGLVPRGIPGWLSRLPEATAVLLLVVVAQTAAIGIPQRFLGPQAGGVLAVLLLAGAGWLFAGSLGSTAHRASAVAIAMVGWPLVAALGWFVEASRSPFAVGPRDVILSTCLAECLLAALLLRGACREAPEPVVPCEVAA